MAITQHILVPDVTIRHLLTTMTMDWRCPLKRPEELQRIQRLKLRNGIEWSEAIKIADPRGFQQIKTRCGEGVLFRMLEFCSQPKMTVRFEILQKLQVKLIGRDRVGFRKSNAFTSVRNERYAWFESLENRSEGV